MQEWLYGEGAIFGTIGYYHTARIGTLGDFYTNVSVGKFFGYCIGYYLHTILMQNSLKGRIAIVEIGSEKGDLISDVAEFFAQFDAHLMLDFLTLEPLISLQNLQQNTFKTRNLNISCICDFNALKACNYDYILFLSNELLDAFACEILWHNTMAFINKETLKLTFKPASEEMLELADLFKISIGEIPMHAFSFAKNLADSAPKWLFLGFDYGDLKPRNAFSLRFYQNHTTENLFLDSTTKNYNQRLLKNFGLTDITYDVNFALWQEAFLCAGGKTWFLHRQNRTLVEMGLDKMCSWYIEKFGLESYMLQSGKLRTLISPGAFGERFFGFAFANF
ncbi:SAM-dependent methyltransferase [Helicobacter turcicus]|uniref:SAM-dependent methyltransferase n=1 Tax=Helicobacter turcicus TaxID=2867412 RepID=A0ABS7JP31_9HELI|nr:SAM-dependent methyltransferase [Helicobacter turcicus]MBX7491152.1 SAM-dependent methyltransferase [Helicobacter turcicus]MBX7546019.1 SAM-dependent methyltransferase [Helicobacter turcicus]